MLATSIPALLLLVPGGAFVDRANPKKTMILTKALLGTSALALAYLTEFGEISYLALIAFALFEGAVGAFDFPALQTVASRLLPKEELQQVIALNATNFHMSRAVGPLVAGIALAWHGPSLVFFIDGISFFILAITMLFVPMHLDNLPPGADNKDRRLFNLENYLSGVRYIVSDKQILYRILQFFLSVCLLFPLSTAIYRAFFRIKFDLTAEVFGYIFSASAFGAMFGAVCLTILKPKEPISILKFGIPVMFVMHMLIIITNTVDHLYPTMFVSGVCSFLIFASVNMSIQIKIKEAFRGRILGIVGLGWLAVGPMLSFPVGWFADQIGYENSIFIISIIFVAGSISLAILNYLHRQHYRQGSDPTQ